LLPAAILALLSAAVLAALALRAILALPALAACAALLSGCVRLCFRRRRVHNSLLFLFIGLVLADAVQLILRALSTLLPGRAALLTLLAATLTALTALL